MRAERKEGGAAPFVNRVIERPHPFTLPEGEGSRKSILKGRRNF